MIGEGNQAYIDGDTAVPFFLQSNLSNDHLAQVWLVPLSYIFL